MDKIKNILKSQFDVDCTDITKINIGLSVATNYKIQTSDKYYFLKIYDKKKSQASLWTGNINSYMPILIWMNENTNLKGKIVRPLKTDNGGFRFDDDEDENVFLLFDYIYGETIETNSFTRSQIIEAAEIMACLHSYGSEIPIDTKKIKEDFSVPFCYALENFMANDYESLPIMYDVKTALQPYLEQIILKNNELKLLSDTVRKKDVKMVLCHTDAHYKNFMQTKHLILVDWEGMKLAPVEADLFMFTQKRYWDIFIEYYSKLNPKFVLDNEILYFYILRRKIEDIWAFIESILHDNLSNEQRKRELAFLLKGCGGLEELSFEL